MGCAIALSLLASACTSSPPVMRYSESVPESEEASRFEFFTRDPALYQSALRAQQRIEGAIGEPGLVLSSLGSAEACEPLQPGCGFELSSRELVYCQGDPEPALACTSQGAGGQSLGIALQAGLSGDQLDNRLIHELFHVITWNRAPHSADGLFMEYSLGTERISTGTLDSVCEHFDCGRFVVEEDLALSPGQKVVVRR
jgi:hypothetical protein